MAVNLIDNEEIHVNQDGSDITLEIQADALKNEDVVVGSIRSKNMFPTKTFISTGTTRIVSNSLSGEKVEGIQVEEGKTYTASFDVSSLPSTTDYRIQLILSSDSMQTQGTTDPTNRITVINLNCGTIQRYSVNITPIQNGYLYLRCVPSGFTLDNIQLEIGDTATSYSPYQQLGYPDAYKGIPSYNNTYLNNIGYCSYVKYGKLVIVNMNGYITQNIPTQTTLFSNLPQLRVSDRALGTITFSNNSSARVFIEGTEIKVDGATNITGWFQGQIVYTTD